MSMQAHNQGAYWQFLIGGYRTVNQIHYEWVVLRFSAAVQIDPTWLTNVMTKCEKNNEQRFFSLTFAILTATLKNVGTLNPYL